MCSLLCVLHCLLTFVLLLTFCTVHPFRRGSSETPKKLEYLFHCFIILSFVDLALTLSHTIQTGQLATVQRFLLAAPHRHREPNPTHSHSSEEADWSGHTTTNLKESPNSSRTKQMLEDTFPWIYQWWKLLITFFRAHQLFIQLIVEVCVKINLTNRENGFLFSEPFRMKAELCHS